MENDTSIIRSLAVGLAMCCDIACNYPLWIAAKRIGANMSPFPTEIRNLYKGGGALWLSLGPTTMVEDKVTSVLKHYFMDDENHNQLDWRHGLASAAASGMVAALLVASQVEHLITASHAQSKSLISTAYSLYSHRGIQHLMLPPGMVAMVGREVPFASALFCVRPMMYDWMLPIGDSVGKGKDGCGGGMTIEKLATSAICGVVTSALVTPVSQAPSVIAAYQQGHNVKAPGDEADTVETVIYSSLLTMRLTVAVREILERYGWRGLFRGMAARTISLAGTFTVVPLALERVECALSPLSSDQ